VTFRAGEGVGTVTRARAAGSAGRARHQSGAAPHDQLTPSPKSPLRPAVRPMPKSRFPFPAAKRWRQRRSTAVSALSAACRSSAPPASSCPIRARPGSIRSIRGIDVARAAGLTHIAGATGASSEAAAQKLYGLPEIALIDMGDFVGGMLKYLRRHPVPRVTIAGGVAKMTKLAQGLTDLHSKRGEVDPRAAGEFGRGAGGSTPSFARASWRPTPPRKLLRLAQSEGIALGDAKSRARHSKPPSDVVAGRDIAIEIVLFDREQNLVGRAPFKRLA
jgi:cobalt-precorrin-5B (C1)-methyltransferase